MGAWAWALIGAGVVVVIYALFVLALFLAGRGQDARALAGFVPDCAVLFTRLMRDPRVPRRHKFLVGALAAYLAMPFDLVPDFIPVAGQLDDAILVGLVLRAVLRGGDETLVREHWPGPSSSREGPRSLNGRLREDERRSRLSHHRGLAGSSTFVGSRQQTA